MIKIKKFLCLFCTLLVILLLTVNCTNIKERIKEEFDNVIKEEEREVTILPGNEYTKKYGFNYVKNSEDYKLTNKEDLKNIIYSIANQGWDEFTFYCDKEYSECLNDVKSELSTDNHMLENIGDFVHPYNSFESIGLYYDTTGKITITMKYKYTKTEIEEIDNLINNIITTNITDNMNIDEKIRVLHDYIINNTKYDKNMEESNTSIYDSKKMTGLLKEHYAICSAYSDVFAVILSKLGVENYKVSNDTHVWNAVKMFDKWYHIDLTWDDPVTNTGEDILLHDYYMIDNNKLNELINNDTNIDNKDKHTFDTTIYSELLQ